jgi:ABC-2 type transport system permease protein
MKTGGMYFSEVTQKDIHWTLFGNAVGAVFGYYLAEMVLQKTWRVFSQIKGLIVYSTAIAFLVLAAQFLGIYENRVK